MEEPNVVATNRISEVSVPMWSSDSVTVPAVCRIWAHADSRPGGTENQEYSGPTMKKIHHSK